MKEHDRVVLTQGLASELGVEADRQGGHGLSPDLDNCKTE